MKQLTKAWELDPEGVTWARAAGSRAWFSSDCREEAKVESLCCTPADGAMAGEL